MMTIAIILMLGLVASAYVLIMTDWQGTAEKQLSFRHQIINRQLLKIRKEADEKEAIQAQYDSIISKGYSR